MSQHNNDGMGAQLLTSENRYLEEGRETATGPYQMGYCTGCIWGTLGGSCWNSMLPGKVCGSRLTPKGRGHGSAKLKSKESNFSILCNRKIDLINRLILWYDTGQIN